MNDTKYMVHYSSISDAFCEGTEEPLYVASQIPTSDIDCDTIPYDPYFHDFHAPVTTFTGNQDYKSPIAVPVLAVLSVLAVAGTAILVFSLHRQQRRSR